MIRNLTIVQMDALKRKFPDHDFDIAMVSFIASDKLTISPGLSICWADDDYMQGFFGVTNTQASRSGLRRFENEAGFKGYC